MPFSDAAVGNIERRIIERTRDMIVSWDCSLRVTSWNPVFERLLTGLGIFLEQGDLLPEILGRVPGTTHEGISLLLNMPLSGEESRFVSCFGSTEENVYDIRTSALLGEDGTIDGAFLIATDITFQGGSESAEMRGRLLAKARAAARKASVERAELEAVFNSMSDAVAILDARGRLVRANHARARMSGFSCAADMPGHGSFFEDTNDLLTAAGEALPFHLWPVSRVLRGERVERFECKSRNKATGAEIDISVSGAPVLGEDGRVQLAVIVTRDITASVGAQRALQESEERFRKLANSLPQIVCTADAEGRTTFFNERWYEYTGVPDNDTSRDGAFVHPEDAGRAREAWTSAIRAGQNFECEYRLRGADGRYRWFLARAIRREGDDSMTWYGSLTDIDDQVRTQEELRLARDEADGANRIKSQFLAVMSHELRTPLTGVLGYTDLLAQQVVGSLNPSQMRFADRIKDCTTHLTHLIDEILLYARVEAGREKLDLKPTEIGTLVRESAQLVQPNADSKALALEVDAGPAPIWVIADERKVRQILLNLLSNAIKFTDSGSVRVMAEQRDGKIVLVVRDTGEGIAASDIKKIFEPFVQADSTLTRRVGGTGLGLAITRRLISLMGGVIDVESEPGRGSAFRVVLPVEAARLRAENAA